MASEGTSGIMGRDLGVLGLVWAYAGIFGYGISWCTMKSGVNLSTFYPYGGVENVK